MSAHTAESPVDGLQEALRYLLSPGVTLWVCTRSLYLSLLGLVEILPPNMTFLGVGLLFFLSLLGGPFLAVSAFGGNKSRAKNSSTNDSILKT